MSRAHPRPRRADQGLGAVLDVSNTATHTALRRFGPVLRPGRRLLVVASSLATLGRPDPRLRHLFDGASLDQMESAVECWRAAVRADTAEDAGRAG